MHSTQRQDATGDLMHPRCIHRLIQAWTEASCYGVSMTINSSPHCQSLAPHALSAKSQRSPPPQLSQGNNGRLYVDQLLPTV